jgi:hypothetical protein
VGPNRVARRLVVSAVFLVAILAALPRLEPANSGAAGGADGSVRNSTLAAALMPRGYTGNGVLAFGNAAFEGSPTNMYLSSLVTSMAATPNGKGYWLASADGGIFNYGDAKFFGSLGKLQLYAPIIGIAATPDGKGYWLVASDGGVFAFGDAKFRGSMGGRHLDAPIVGIAATPDGRGYWLAA